MIPLIILSTLTGTANFAQNSFPVSVQSFVPSVIGAVNLFVAIVTTLYQFLKISELMESHRIVGINYAKLGRHIAVELNLPVKDRSTSGAEFVKVCRADVDRLLEQSPPIPMNILKKYDAKYGKDEDLVKPEILYVNKINVFVDPSGGIAGIVADAAARFLQIVNKSNPFASRATKTDNSIIGKVSRGINYFSRRDLSSPKIEKVIEVVNHGKDLEKQLEKDENELGQIEKELGQVEVEIPPPVKKKSFKSVVHKIENLKKSLNIEPQSIIEEDVVLEEQNVETTLESNNETEIVDTLENELSILKNSGIVSKLIGK
jgi:hypothetical protein